MNRRAGFRRPGRHEPADSALSPMGRQLLEQLRRAGSEGLELDRLKAAGAAEQVRALARRGVAVALDGNIHYARETYGELGRRILEGLPPGQHFSIGFAKQRTGLSRKYILPLLNRMEADGLVRREGDERVVIRPPEDQEGGARPGGTPAG